MGLPLSLERSGLEKTFTIQGHNTQPKKRLEGVFRGSVAKALTFEYLSLK